MSAPCWCPCSWVAGVCAGCRTFLHPHSTRRALHFAQTVSLNLSNRAHSVSWCKSSAAADAEWVLWIACVAASRGCCRHGTRRLQRSSTSVSPYSTGAVEVAVRQALSCSAKRCSCSISRRQVSENPWPDGSRSSSRNENCRVCKPLPTNTLGKYACQHEVFSPSDICLSSSTRCECACSREIATASWSTSLSISII